MVFSLLHWLPSALAAVLIIALAIFPHRHHGILSRGAVIFGVLGLAGYLYAGNYRFWPLDLHTIHSIIGVSALILSVITFFRGSSGSRDHCPEGQAAAFLASLALVMGAVMLAGLAFNPSEIAPGVDQVPASSDLPEIEASEFQGVNLTPIADQGNNAIAGTQEIDRGGYRLRVTGLVERDLNLTYDDLLDRPAYSKAVYMPCVEGWGFYAKWTGLRVSDILNESGIAPGGVYVLFKSADGYTTGLPLDYLQDRRTLLAYGINDVTLPRDRGFPLQVVAEEKYGYKWGKWITEIEVVDEEVRGYWESRGYSNDADVGGFPFG